jgi:TetR/AcrR family transcriptional regulator, cholesterol catabolism regulator
VVRNGGDRRTQILSQAALTFLRNGYDATSMSEIAERCGITKPGLYYHFKGKQDLLYAIMSHAMDMLEQRSLADMLSATSHEARLRSILHSHVRLITELEDGAFTILVIEGRNALRSEDRRIIEHRVESYTGWIRATLEGLRTEGKLREIDSAVATASLLGLVVWTARWYRRGGRMSGDEIADQVTELGLASVLRGPADPPASEARPTN